MADDITLTVRVRNQTRGEFDRLGDQLRRMNREMRRTGQQSNMSSESMKRFGDNIRGVSKRMNELKRTGNLAGHEMTYMRRTMSILNRELAHAARNGDLTTDQFKALRRELERTQLDFDQLNRDVERHNTIAQRAARQRAEAQREARRLAQEADRLRREQQRAADRAARDAARQQAQVARQAARAAAQAVRDAARAEAAELARVRDAAADPGFAARVRGLSGGDHDRFEMSLRGVAAGMNTVSVSTADARDAVARFNRDMDVANRLLEEMRNNGSISRRDFQALAGSVDLMDRNARNLSRSGAMTSDTFRTMHRDLGGLRRGLAAVGQTAGIFTRLGDAARRTGSIFQRLVRLAIVLAPTLVPIAAVAGSAFLGLAATVGGAAVALGAFGAALAPQVSGIMKVVQAQSSYEEAVRTYGSSSKKAMEQQSAYARTLNSLTPIQQRAAIGFVRLRDAYVGWSDSLAGDTVPVLMRSFVLVEQMLPRLTSTVKASSKELGRTMTILTGGIRTDAFKKSMERFADFTTRIFGGMNVEILQLMNNMGNGSISGPFRDFMDYVREVGPMVSHAFGGLGDAFSNLARASSDAGVTLLNVIGMLGEMIGAIPTDLLSIILQFVFAFKAFGLVAGMVTGLGAALAVFRVQLAAAMTAAAGAPGILAKLTAAFLALSRGAQLAVAGTAIGALVVAFMELSKIGEEAPINVDKLSASLVELGHTGKATGELTRVFGKDMEDLEDSLRFLERPSTGQSIKQWWEDKVKLEDTDTSKTKQAFKDIDESLVSLGKGGKAELAAAAFEQLKKSIGNMTPEELMNRLPEYAAFLAAMKKEAELAAESMGAFGAQAAAVQSKLDAQKRAADGLRESILALNDINLAASKAASEFEAAIDEIAAGTEKINGLSIGKNNLLNVDTEEARTAEGLLRKLSEATRANALAAIEQGASAEQVNAIFQRGHGVMEERARSLLKNKEHADELASAMLMIPDKKLIIQMMADQAKRDLEEFNAKLAATKDKKSVTLTTLSSQAEEVLKRFGYQVERLPDGTVKVTVTGGALGAIGNIANALNGINGQTANTYIYTNHIVTKSTQETRSTRKLRAGHMASGGPVRGPGSGTSDDVPIMASNGEYMLKASSVRKYGLRFLDDLNDGRLGRPLGYAKGGKISQATRDARNQMRNEQTISYFGRIAGYKNPEMRRDMALPDSLGALVDTLNKYHGLIKKAFSGKTEKNLLKQLDRSGRALITHEKRLSGVTKRLDAAKEKLADLKQAAASLSEGVKNGIVSGANITRLAGGDKKLTLSGAMSGMRQNRDKATAFAGALEKLKAKGFSASIISQIAEAGVDGGGLETAQALLGASSSDVGTFNKMQSEIESAAKKSGKIASDAMYGAGIKAAEGLVKGLTNSKKAIEKAMMDIAKSMEKAIKKALGIKSPSKVMEQIGAYTAEGFTVGYEKKRESWDSMMTVPRTPSASRAVGSSGAVVIEIRSSGSAQDDFLLQWLRKSIRVRGGNVQVVLGK